MSDQMVPLGVAATLSANGDTLTVGVDPNIDGAVVVEIAGTWTGTVTFKGRVGTAALRAIGAAEAGTPNTYATTATANGIYSIPCGGLQSVVIELTTLSTGGPITVTPTITVTSR